MSDIIQPTILVIDDDANIINLLTRRLSQEGFNVISAKDGSTGLDMAKNKMPNLIILDLLMPEVSGKEVLVELKSNPETEPIPVIIVSAVADTEDKIDGLSLGANDYIVKPFRFREVIARVNTQLRISSMHKNLEEKHNDLLEKNKVLKKLVVTDPLTGLLNKGYLMKRLKSEISRSSRYNEPVSIMMLDIDHFKKINDSYGHLAGDETLKHIAMLIKDMTRTMDIATRYGGEEFVVVCPNTSLEGVVKLAERVRKRVEDTPITIDETQIKSTISIGVACESFNASDDINTAMGNMIDKADNALYRAKSNGRNRVEVS